MKYAVLLMMTLLILSGNGCGHKIVKHPDASMLIEQVGWGRVSVAIYDKESNSLIHYGWVKIQEGWTLHKFDWERYIESR